MSLPNIAAMTAAVLLTLLLLLGGISARADDIGPPIGALAPQSDTMPVDQSGVEQSLDALMGEEGLVVFFNRSVDWCRYCQAQVIEVNERRAELEAQGYGVVSITTDSVEELAAFDAKRDIQFPLLSDEGSQLIRLWGLLDPAYPEGNRNHGLPFPSTFIIDRNGVVRDKQLRTEVYGHASAFQSRVSFDEVNNAARSARRAVADRITP